MDWNPFSLAQVWSELERHRAQCGAPSAACAHARYSAIGTTRGAVFLFDHFQAPVAVLSKAVTAETAARGAVISLDISPEGDTLIAGHTNGHVCTARACLLRMLDLGLDYFMFCTFSRSRRDRMPRLFIPPCVCVDCAMGPEHKAAA